MTDDKFDKVETVTDMKSRLMAEGGGGNLKRSAPPKEAT